MLYRNQLRSILVATETTEKTRSVGAPFLAFPLTTAQAFYVGFHEKFVGRYFYLKVANA
ncbi:MAG: hypothetical protein HOO67_03390, partial [Candidatus Peribacteraceae bacterium]|nr:hypothetical protein [Candidatus Peribacteraceae bacterium]